MTGLEVEKIGASGGGETVYEIDVTPNRGDCLSVLGIAREVSACTGRPMKERPAAPDEAGWETAERIAVRVGDEEMCPRYAARVIEGVTAGESPGWLRERLEAVGIRPVNNVVDVTNYVLIELGQPLHAFDLDRLSAPRITVRRAGAGEKIVTIDGEERALEKGMLLIADESGPVAIAGVMGGRETEVSEKTERILLECACFDARSVRKTSKRLNLSTESSYRFERGVDIEAVPRAIDRAARLIAEIAGGEIGRGRVDIRRKRRETVPIALGQDGLRRTLGKAYSEDKVRDVLRRLAFSVEEAGEGLSVRPPPFRNDIHREVDLVEEVARMSGYDSIPASLPEMKMAGTGRTAGMLLQERLRKILEGMGFDEAITYSFISADDFDRMMLGRDDPRRESIEIVNPVSREHSRMRTTMVPGILKVMQTNASRGVASAAVYEIGRIYSPGERERARLGLALIGEPLSGREPLDFFTVKGLVLSMIEALGIPTPEVRRHRGPLYHPGQAASIAGEGGAAAVFGRLHPRVAENYGLACPVFMAEVSIEELERRIPPVREYRPLPKHPSIRRDIAMIVDDDLPYGRVEALIKNSGFDTIRKVKLFDLYRGKQIPAGKKSLAVTVIYRSESTTLTDKEVNRTHRLLCEMLVTELQCIVRKE